MLKKGEDIKGVPTELQLPLDKDKKAKDIGEMEFYLQVDDIEQVWNKMKGKVGGMKFKEPFDREYGMREVHIIIPETKTLMFIGQEIR